MINYSIPKPHPLCGHFIKINSESEYNQMREIAEGCGFAVSDYNKNPSLSWCRFDNDKAVVYVGESNLSGQEITLNELRELAELSKITLPCEMEVWNTDGDLHELKEVIDFYKGHPVEKIPCIYRTWNNYRLPNHRAGEIKAKIKEHQEAIDKLNQELESIK
jgi:hypothetical protein